MLHEAEVASRSEARREAVRARARRPNPDADYEEGRAPRKTNSGKFRGENATAENAAPKRRKVERPATMDTGAPMERSASGTGGQRGANKDGAEKKRSRAPNPNAAAARKKYVLSISPFHCLQLTVFSLGPPLHRTLDRRSWPPHLLSAPSTIPRVVLLVQDRTHRVHNPLEPNRMPGKRAIPDKDPLPPRLIVLVRQTLVCPFALRCFVSILLTESRFSQTSRIQIYPTRAGQIRSHHSRSPRAGGTRQPTCASRGQARRRPPSRRSRARAYQQRPQLEDLYSPPLHSRRAHPVSLTANTKQ